LIVARSLSVELVSERVSTASHFASRATPWNWRTDFSARSSASLTTAVSIARALPQGHNRCNRVTLACMSAFMMDWVLARLRGTAGFNAPLTRLDRKCAETESVRLAGSMSWKEPSRTAHSKWDSWRQLRGAEPVLAHERLIPGDPVPARQVAIACVNEVDRSPVRTVGDKRFLS